ncbi:hypothetical protein HY491_01770 [Candidatus Woesearchaeota archaeon]|nr:hypothetical protein [Candidatus Woesearchaeota archaeon]
MRIRQPTGMLGKALKLGLAAAVSGALGITVVDKAAERERPLEYNLSIRDVPAPHKLQGMPAFSGIEDIEHDAPDTITAPPFSLDVSEIATRTLPASSEMPRISECARKSLISDTAWSKRAISEYAQEHAPGGS